MERLPEWIPLYYCVLRNAQIFVQLKAGLIQFQKKFVIKVRGLG